MRHLPFLSNAEIRIVTRHWGRDTHFMGVDLNGLRGLMIADAMGVRWGKTLTLGRQHIRFTREDFVQAGREAGCPEPVGALPDGEPFLDPWLKVLGAQSVEALDASDFEGATLLQDLNAPWTEGFPGPVFDVVLDAGTLEHVFNVPQALATAMRLVAPGGYYIGYSPMNNFAGHGFYQFSPEFWFAAFSREQGFEMEVFYAFDDLPEARWHRVLSPAEAGGRVQLTGFRPASSFFIARRLETGEPLRTWPIQKDYDEAWRQGDNAPAQHVVPAASGLRNLLPRGFKDRLRTWIGIKENSWTSPWFQVVEPGCEARTLRMKSKTNS